MVKIVNKRGTVSISANVFTNVAGEAATRCFGVKGMVGKTKETGIYQLLRGESMSKGVSVSFDDDDNTVSIALHIGVDQGVNLAALGRSIMNEVSYKVSQSTGVKVKRVDVYVDAMLLG
ncbi:MAG: Asp23/Gls24 family envelope stress response protein [Oscillospiraceae bacterium]|nr:Asp23/Gls24 family envelope stress response protein [Oscillospiraceae bacterium]